MREKELTKEYAKSLAFVSKTLLECNLDGKKEALITMIKELQKASNEFIKILQFDNNKKYLA